jgi:hypothetical protein
VAISSTVSSVSYVGNNSAVTAYTITFRYDAATWLLVEQEDAAGVRTTLANGVDFTLGGDGSATTGTLVTAIAVPVTENLHITRVTPATQSLALSLNAPIPTPDVEANLDKLAMQQQDTDREFTRAILAPRGETPASLPLSTARASKGFAYDASGNPTVDEIYSADEKASVASISSGAAAERGVAKAANDAARAALAPEYVGQKMVQTDKLTAYLATGTGAGEWTRALTTKNVKHYGAVGDGVADDTAAIQAAIDDTTCNVVMLPKGTYRITAVLETHTGLTMKGEGRNSSIIHQATNAENAFEMPAAGPNDYCTFQDFQVLGNGSSTSTGWAFQMRDPGGGYFFRFVWNRVTVRDFGGAYDIYKTNITTWTHCQCWNCGNGWHLDDLDMVALINCGFQGNPNEAEYGLKSITKCFNGQVIGGDWGGFERAWDFGRGSWLVQGTNIEACTKDGIIKVSGALTTVNLKHIKFLYGTEEVSNQAVVLIDASDGSTPVRVTLEGMQWSTGGTWRNIVVRGTYYYLPQPIEWVNNGVGTTIYLEEGSAGAPGGTQRANYRGGLPFPAWHPTLINQVANTEAGNLARRGDIIRTLPHNTLAGYVEELRYFYTGQDGRNYQTSLCNDTLAKVVKTVNAQQATVSTTELTLLEYSVPAYFCQFDGETLLSVVAGKFAANANNKTLKYYLAHGTALFSSTVTHNDKQFVLTATAVKRGTTSTIIMVKLEVDGVAPVIQQVEATITALGSSRTLKVTATGVSDNDILCHNARLTWLRAESDYHQTP